MPASDMPDPVPPLTAAETTQADTLYTELKKEATAEARKYVLTHASPMRVMKEIMTKCDGDFPEPPPPAAPPTTP